MPSGNRPTSGSNKDRRNAAPSGPQKPAAVVLDRVLPNSVDAEIAVLGAMLISPEASALACDRLTAEHFYHAPHHAIFNEIHEMQDALQAVDLVTLSQRLRDKNLIEEVGGPAYLTDLITRVPTAANVEHYLEIVNEKFQLRKLIEAGQDMVARCFDPQDEVKGWLDEVEQQVFAITSEKSGSVVRPAKDFVKNAMTSIERMYDNRGTVTGVSTGFRDLDRMTSGLHDGEMVIIAGRPSMGKTALAMNIAEHVALDQNLAVGVFSLEMSAEELVKRALCSRAKVNLRAVRDGFLSEKDFHPLTTAASQLMKAPLYIDDSAGLTVNQVRSRSRRMKSQYGVRLLVVDYLQLMRAPSRRADLNRQVEISDISAGLKALAKELKLPIVVLSQLNRQPEAREGGKPRLADLRESGAIEQDADVVGLLVRPEIYEDDEQERADKSGEATLIIAKQRNGPTGDVLLTFQKEYTRFVDRARVEQEDVPAFERSEA